MGSDGEYRGAQRPAGRVGGCRDDGSRSVEWTVFVDNLSKKVSRFELKEIFNFYGKVTRLFIPMSNNKSRYRNFTFAFVTLASRADMERVISRLDKSSIGGVRINVSKAKYPKRVMEPPIRMGVAGRRREVWRRKENNANQQPHRPEGSGRTFQKKSYKDVLLNNDVEEEEKKGAGDNGLQGTSKRHVMAQQVLDRGVEGAIRG
ncbi:hypothetical protein HRI_002478200 [Hibiscus trionum]|uniref:RRM domain-containing protein n=1 Tax=Hibiscus trionum TaxID=183268 RepID=A0A9W7I2F1_HIBTR|nr:hypothetical protein HRI_002478200 [Hibiscus trionum]